MTKNTNSVNGGAMSQGLTAPPQYARDRRHFIGGSDARIIMGKDEKALHRLWREKRGEAATSGPVGRPDRPARPGHRGPQPPLV